MENVHYTFGSWRRKKNKTSRKMMSKGEPSKCLERSLGEGGKVSTCGKVGCCKIGKMKVSEQNGCVMCFG